MSPRANLNRERVLLTALELADAHGYDHLTLAGVAAALGIRLPSLYNHVDGLPGLRRDTALWGTRQLADELRRAAVGRAGSDAIVHVARAYRTFAHQHPGAYTASLQHPSPEDVQLNAAAGEVFDVVAAVLRPYNLQGDDLIHAMRGLRSVMHGFVTLEHVGGFGMSVDREASFERLLAIYLHGLESSNTGNHLAKLP